MSGESSRRWSSIGGCTGTRQDSRASVFCHRRRVRAARDGFIDLRLASDLGAWWDVYGADLRSGVLDGLLDAYPALARVVPVAVRVAEKLVGLPSSNLIEEMPKFCLREGMALRLANPHPQASRAQLYADTGLIDGLLTPPGGFNKFLRRQVLPPPEVLAQQARQAARGRARSPLVRSAGILARYVLTMARLMRVPARLP